MPAVVAERSKAVDSRSIVATLVGSNPTDCIFIMFVIAKKEHQGDLKTLYGELEHFLIGEPEKQQ